jgi:hypothetical protein
LIADETALELGDLHDEASFAELGVDSLMSLVISEKFREDLGIIVSGSLFLEYLLLTSEAGFWTTIANSPIYWKHPAIFFCKNCDILEISPVRVRD